jgi:hypothetical protein
VSRCRCAPCTESVTAAFRGIAHESDFQIDVAAAEYERSVSHLIKRAERELAKPQSPKHETERSFIIYCLGKLELRFAYLDFERGRLTAAKRHAWEAGLLRSSKDIYLPCLADLLTYEIRRYEPGFVKTGWDLVKQMDRYATADNKHVPNRLHARTEQIKTCVYLRHLNAEPREQHPTFLPLESAQSAIEKVIHFKYFWLGIRLPPWMGGDEAFERVGMQNAGCWNPALDD